MLIIIIVISAVFLLLFSAYLLRHKIINAITEPEGHPANEPAPYKNETGDDIKNDPVPEDQGRVYNILICGRDKVSGLTDVNLLVNFNTTDLTMAIMQIPRDVHMYHDGYYYTKANGVVRCYGDDGWDSSDPYVQSVIDKFDANNEDEKDMRGIAGFAALLERNLCVKIHYYAIMDLDGFINIVDALGGVEMNVPYDLHYEDPNQNLYIHINQGYQLLDGKAAEGVVRYREGFGLADIGRGNVQKMFMASLVKTIQDNANIFNADKIIKVCNIVADNLITNMSTSDMIYFANNAMTLDMQYVTFMTAPVGGDYDAAAGTWYTCINKETTLNYINSYFNIYKDPVTAEEFDSNYVFYFDSIWYNGPAGTVPEYIYKGSEMTEFGFKPVVGY